jgi:hypothetical protein
MFTDSDREKLTRMRNSSRRATPEHLAKRSVELFGKKVSARTLRREIANLGLQRRKPPRPRSK